MLIPGYAIRRTLGKGGMATVYLATQESLRRQIALKTLRLDPEEADDEGPTLDEPEDSRTERFIREGRIVASLSHPSVVQIFDIGATERVMYIAMEYVPGGDLQGRLGVPLPPHTALNVVIRIGAALEAAHARGVIHRDVKPANILFREDGTPLLSDFGIAKEIADGVDLTLTGRVLGSPFYMSPEQADCVTLDSRSDLYSLGVILYEMLSGRRPYEGVSAVKIIMQHLQAPVPRLEGRAAPLQPLLDRMMAKDPAQRFASAREMVSYAGALGAEVYAEGSGSYPAETTAAEPTAPVRPRIAEEVVDGFRRGILEDLSHDRLVLPSLPDVALAVRREVERPNATGTSIARAVAADPALSAQLLRVANSAYYFGQAPVRDVRRAVVRLGSRVVNQVIMMLVVAQLYDVGSRDRLRPHLGRLWRHSTVVAAIAERIARRVPGLDRDAAMLAGLIHDIGALPVLVWAEPIPSVIESERSLGGIIDALHADLGRAILEQWRYPADLIAVPAEHERLDREPLGPDLADVVQVANFLAYRGTGQPKAAFDWASLPAAKRLGLGADDEEGLLSAALTAATHLASALGNE